MPKELIHASRRLTLAEQEALKRRALAAWFSAGAGTSNTVPMARVVTKRQSDDGTEHLQHFVVLHAAGEVLAVYRVRNDNLLLRRMARWPKDLVRLGVERAKREGTDTGAQATE